MSLVVYQDLLGKAEKATRRVVSNSTWFVTFGSIVSLILNYTTLIGGHEVFDDHVADLEKDHAKEIHNGQLMMQYRIQCAEKWYNEALRVVEEESEASCYM